MRRFMRFTRIVWQRAAAWRILAFVILLALPACLVADSFSDAAGLDDEPAFAVADEDVVVDRQPIASHPQVFRSDLPLAAECRLPALTRPLFAWSQPLPAIPWRSELPRRNSPALARAALAASSRTPIADPAS